MFEEITITKELQKFNCCITLFGKTLGVFTIEYDGVSLKNFKWKRERNKVAVFLNLKLYSYLSSDVSNTQL